MNSQDKAAKNAAIATKAPKEPAPRRTRAGRKLGRAATGTDNFALQQRLVGQVLGVTHAGEGGQASLETSEAALKAIAPRDGVEGLVASQMAASHETAMDCLRRARTPGQSLQAQDIYYKHAAKFLQLHIKQLEALDKHRGHGQQKITVEHVNVHAGGQAVVGNVQAPAASEARAPATPLSLTDQTGDVVHLPDPLTSSLKRTRQPSPRRASE
jgi:hypothetical protein